VERLARVADEVRVLSMDPDFEAVGRYYDVFAQRRMRRCWSCCGRQGDWALET
jgi:hypothetical protein